MIVFIFGIMVTGAVKVFVDVFSGKFGIRIFVRQVLIKTKQVSNFAVME